MATLNALYQELILDHNRAPRNYRSMDNANRRVEGHNPLCGDRLTVWLRMEGDLIETIRGNIQWIGHFHTGGVPGRHELNGTQEIQWDAVMRAIADSGFRGYVAHEFIPTGDPLASLKSAADLCDV